jgi:N-methylhydantoinase A
VQPTLTDANLVLGYLDPDFFLGGDMALDAGAARAAIQSTIADPLGISLERAASGIHEILSEDVARAFRIHASERGFDYRQSSMVAFGGSGPVHALSVARKLRIPRVIFPVAAGVMSALGLLASPLAFEVSSTREEFVDDLLPDAFTGRFRDLVQEASLPLIHAGLAEASIELQCSLDMRYHGQGHEIEVTLPVGKVGAARFSELAQLFKSHYERLYSGASLDAPLVITNWKVKARGPLPSLAAGYTVNDQQAEATTVPQRHRQAWFGSEWYPIPVYNLYALRPGDELNGPALIEERESTIVVGPGERVHVDERRNVVAELSSAEITR